MFGWLKFKAESANKTLGQIGEEQAQAEYKKRGYQVIAANFFNRSGKRLGEIDFVAKNESQIIFVEVKTRTGVEGRFGTAAEAVNFFKQKKLLRAVKVFLAGNPEYQKLQPQIDVCVMEYSEVDKAFKPAKIIANAVEDMN